MTEIVQHIFPAVSKWRWVYFFDFLIFLVIFYLALFTLWWTAIVVGIIFLYFLVEYFLMVDEIYLDAIFFHFRKWKKVVQIEREKISNIRLWNLSGSFSADSFPWRFGWADFLYFSSTSLMYIKPRKGNKIPLRHRFLLAVTTSDEEEYWPLKQDLHDLFPEQKEAV